MTEKVKKTKAPAKPRAPRKTAAKKDVIAEAAAESVTIHVPTHEEIARLAEQYWMERGRQDGGAEQDWLRAEQTLTQMAS